MLPGLQEGDEVLFDTRAYQQRMPKVGEIVVAHHPEQAGVKVVKRITAVTHNNAFHLQGDNPETYFDHFISADQIIGRVTSRFG